MSKSATPTAQTAVKKSRLGKKPIALPDKVKAAVTGSSLKVEGPKGSLTLEIPFRVQVSVDQSAKIIQVDINSPDREARAFHGLYRSLIQNIVIGVEKGYEKKVEVFGVDYSAQMKGAVVSLAVGFSHTVDKAVPQGLVVKIEKVANDKHVIFVSGIEKQKVGQFAAELRRVRPPEPYKGKGLRYADEVVRRKQGKAFGAK